MTIPKAKIADKNMRTATSVACLTAIFIVAGVGFGFATRLGIKSFEEYFYRVPFAEMPLLCIAAAFAPALVYSCMVTVTFSRLVSSLFLHVLLVGLCLAPCIGAMSWSHADFFSSISAEVRYARFALPMAFYTFAVSLINFLATSYLRTSAFGTAQTACENRLLETDSPRILGRVQERSIGRLLEATAVCAIMAAVFRLAANSSPDSLGIMISSSMFGMATGLPVAVVSNNRSKSLMTTVCVLTSCSFLSIVVASHFLFLLISADIPLSFRSYVIAMFVGGVFGFVCLPILRRLLIVVSNALPHGVLQGNGTSLNSETLRIGQTQVSGLVNDPENDEDKVSGRG